MRRGERDRPLDRIDAPKFLPNRAVCVSTELTLTPSLTFPPAPIVAGSASRAPGTAGLSALGSPMRPPRDSNSTAPPQSPSRAEAARFELAENARLALEAKSAQVEGLKVKLAAAEAALREHDEREREEQRARASSEHAGVMHEADRLGDEMKGALGNVKAFVRRAWTGAATASETDVTAGNRTPERTTTTTTTTNAERDGFPRTPSSAMRSKAKTSIVEKPAARGAYLRGGDAPGGDSLTGGQRPKTVAFVGDREQRRLEREGEVVADNARLRRTIGELERRLKRLARVARRACDAAESKFADERAARLDAEEACERLRAALEEAERAGVASSGLGKNVGKNVGQNVGTFGRSLVEELETSRSTCRDVLLVARCAARVNAADPDAIVAALPALAALAGERQGDTAHALADNGVAVSAAAAMEAHARNASVAKAGCELIATLARGGGPSVPRGLAGSARKAAAAVARDFTTAASASGGGGGGGRAGSPKISARSAAANPSVAVVDALRRHANDAATCAAAADAAWAAAHHGGVAVAARLLADGAVAALADAMALHPTDHEVVSKGSHAVCCVASTSAGNATEAASQGGAAAVAAAMRDGAADAIAAYPSTERWVAEHGAGRSSRSRSRAGDDVDDESWLVEYERGSVGRTAGRAPRKVEVEEEDGDGDSGSFDFDSNL